MITRPVVCEALERRVLLSGTVVARLPDGKTLVEDDVSLTRLNADGTVDSTFGANGNATIPVQGAQLGPVTIEGDGKILIGGDVQRLPNLLIQRNATDLLLARLNTNGSLDQNFGTGGVVVDDVNSRDDAAAALAIQGDGKIIVAGWDYNFPGDPGMANARPFVLRFASDGAPDFSFGQQGKVLVTVPGSWYAEAHAISIQPNGNIVLSTSAIDTGDESGTTSHPVVFTFDSSGNQLSVMNSPRGSGGGQTATDVLVVKAFDLSRRTSDLIAGAQETAVVRVSNTGNTLSDGPVDFIVYAANPGAGGSTAGATEVGRFMKVVRLKPGASRTLRATFTISSLPPAGQYVLTVAPAGSNAAAEGPDVSVAAAGTDLSVAFARPAPLSLARGGRGSITLDLMNVGRTPIGGPVDVNVLASPDGSAGPAAQPVAAFHGLPLRLKPGRHKRLRLRFAVPATVAAGDLFLLATVSTSSPDANPFDNTAVSQTGTRIE